MGKVKKNTFFNSSVVIHFFTHKESPDFDGPKSKIAQNCPKINFAFDQKIQNSKTKVKNDPLKSKKHFLTVKKVIHFLTNKERPDYFKIWTLLVGQKVDYFLYCQKVFFDFKGSFLTFIFDFLIFWSKAKLIFGQFWAILLLGPPCPLK